MCSALGACRNRHVVKEREKGIDGAGEGVQKGEIIVIVVSEFGSIDHRPQS